MTYIILAAGKGTKLQPLTLKTPKSLYKLDKDTTVLQRMIRTIRRYDSPAEIVVVAGFMYETIEKEVADDNVIVVRNPFYNITNSIASLWFAREYLQRDNVTIIDGDIVAENKLVKDIVCQPTDKPYVLINTESKNDDKYNVQIQGLRICVMSKALTNYHAQYMCVTKLDGISSRFLANEVNDLINSEMYDLLFEDALVSMIFARDFELYYKDIKDYSCTEVDCIDDLLEAKKVQAKK